MSKVRRHSRHAARARLRLLALVAVLVVFAGALCTGSPVLAQSGEGDDKPDSSDTSPTAGGDTPQGAGEGDQGGDGSPSEGDPPAGDGGGTGSGETPAEGTGTQPPADSEASGDGTAPGDAPPDGTAPGVVPAEGLTPAGTLVGTGTDTLAAPASPQQVPPGGPPLPDGTSPIPPGPSPAPTQARGFHPNYTSRYDINRNTQTWTQGFDFSLRLSDVLVTNNTQVVLGEDTTLKRDRKDNSTTTTLAYDVTQILRFSGTLGFRRSSTIDGGVTESRQNSDNFTGAVEFEPTLTGGVNTKLVGTGGTQKSSIFNRLTSDRESNGPNARLSADFDRSYRLWNWTARTLIGTSKLTSRESTTGTVTNDENFDGNAAFTVDLSVPAFKQFGVAANRDYTRTQEPFTRGTAVTQETSTRLSRGFALNVATETFHKLDWSARYSFRNNDVNRLVDLQRAQETIDRAFGTDMAYILPDSTHMSAKLDLSVQRTLYDDPSRKFLDGNIETRSFGGRLERRMSRKARVEASGQYEIRSYLFDDLVSNQDDRDVVRADFGARMNYDPAHEFKTLVIFTFKHDQTIFIDQSKSSGNQTQQSFNINPQFTYNINPRITFKEDASVIAIQRVFDFDEDRNRLSRTTEFRTSIDAKLVPRLDAQLRHVFRILQDGTWRQLNPGEPRKFGKSSETVTRDLTFRADYRAFQGGSMFFRVNQRMGDTTTRQLIGGDFADVVSTNEYTELEAGGQLRYTLAVGTGLGFNLRRVQNWTDRNVRNNYWVGDLSINHSF